MNTSRIIASCLFGIVIVSPIAAEDPPATKLDSFRIAGYLPDYRRFDPAAATGLTDIMLFSASFKASGELDLSRLKRMPVAKIKAFKTQQRIRLILSVGGWQRSSNFGAVSTSDELRKKFVDSAVKTCIDERFDGLDLDWEHPKNAAEEEGYAKLLTDLHQAFEPHGLVVTVTIAGWQKLPRRAFEVVDWVNLMAYDHDGRHSTFEGAQSDVKKLLDAGVPPGKLTLGLPFYGREIKRHDHEMTYREIVARLKPEKGADEVDGIYFNGPETIARKTKYAIDSGLAGVMYWEMGQDVAGDQSLLKAIISTVEQAKRK